MPFALQHDPDNEQDRSRCIFGGCLVMFTNHGPGWANLIGIRADLTINGNPAIAIAPGQAVVVLSVGDPGAAEGSQYGYDLRVNVAPITYEIEYLGPGPA